MIPVLQQEFTIRKGPLYIIAAVFILFIYILFKKDMRETSAYLAGGGLLLLLVLRFVLIKMRLIIDDDGITQELLFGKRRHIAWSDIQSSKLYWQFHGHSASPFWEFVGAGGKRIEFQPTMYTRSQLQLIAAALLQKSKRATVDSRVTSMAAGKFPWYIF